MSKPPRYALIHSLTYNYIFATPSYDLYIRNPINPPKTTDIPQTIHLNCSHSSPILHLQNPRFITIQQTRFNYPLIYSNFCFSTNMPPLPDIFQSSPGSPCLSYSVIHLLIHSTVIRNIHPQVSINSNLFHPSTIETYLYLIFLSVLYYSHNFTFTLIYCQLPSSTHITKFLHQSLQLLFAFTH